MKAMFRYIFVSMLFIPAGVCSQNVPDMFPPQEKPMKRPPVINPEREAERLTDEMQHELQLTDKQYKKVYKLFLKEQKLIAEMEVRHLRGKAGDFPLPNRRPEGSGFPPPPPGGFPGGMDMGKRPPMPSAGEDLHGKLEKQREKNAKKLKKILSPEQYDRWADYRLRHPERKDRQQGHAPVR